MYSPKFYSLYDSRMWYIRFISWRTIYKYTTLKPYSYYLISRIIILWRCSSERLNEKIVLLSSRIIQPGNTSSTSGSLALCFLWNYILQHNISLSSPHIFRTIFLYFLFNLNFCIFSSNYWVVSTVKKRLKLILIMSYLGNYNN